MAKDLILEVLKQIRDEAKATNKRLERLEKGQLSTNDRLERLGKGQSTTNERLEGLDRRQAETEIRLATELVAVVGAVRELRDTLVADRHLRKTVEGHERRISALEQHSH